MAKQPPLPKQRRPNGRPPHQPTADQRERVAVLAAGGMSQVELSAAIGISEPTLRLHYAEQLTAGAAAKRALVLEAMFKAATAGNVSAQKAWLAQHRELQDPASLPVSRPAPQGKKEAAAEAAIEAQAGSPWSGLLPH